MAETKPILVPLDGSKLAENALPAAAWLSSATGAPIRFIHVLDAGVEGDERTKAAEAFRAYTQDQARLHNLGETTCDVSVGAADAEIIRDAETASAVVLATHGRGGFRATVIGSVADKVIRSSPVPVLAEPGAGEPNPPAAGEAILVGLDGSEEAEAGLTLAREIAARTDMQVILMRSYSVPPPAGIEFSYYPADLLETLEKAAGDYLAATARPGEKTILMQGDPSNSVLEAAESHDVGLIVLTSSGKGLTRRVALGSTTARVVHSTHRSVLILPHKKAAQ